MTASQGGDVQARLRLLDRLERLWADTRLDTVSGADVRALAEALLWASYYKLDSETTEDGGNRYTEWVTARLGKKDWKQVASVIRRDAPRYEPPDDRWTTPCLALVERGPRAGQPCNARPVFSDRVTDPVTGQWTVEGYCRRHEPHHIAATIAERARRQSGSVPEPLPNHGGLLPCHTNVTNWPDLYAWADWGWKPPRVGIRADDWPTMAKVVEKEPPKLVLLVGGGRATPRGAWDDVYDMDSSPASLSLVPTVGGDDD